MPETDGYQPLRRELSRSPETLREMFAALHYGRGSLNDCFLDDVLGLPLLGDQQERLEGQRSLYTEDGRLERVVYQGTPYNLIREGINWVQPTASDVVYDLGCGYGRVCLYGALNTEAQWRGVELASSRLAVARNVQEQFAIANVAFREGNAVEENMEDGTIFYLFNPFSDQTLADVMEKLRDIASKKPIRIISYWTWWRWQIPSWLKVVKTSRQDSYFTLLASQDLSAA